ncbi:TonB-dependent receptor [Stenotrophomonas sp. MMGLT7]|uniref:TonB-dependent receptor n=1 Tax=Stenotrophomonas sp. MMGLT7 TaxID=2901227 RepID=UPI001E5D913B|nr:TonB-dependent receptor [Stenotrophomonas sp. MMGLT7]MCD7097733.1 TonB-dependent receptor [Stenotrophomonas sp. MMGLT7]
MPGPSLQRRPLAGALLIALACLPCTAQAQDTSTTSADPTTLDTVVVSGYRQSVERAADLKRDAVLQRDSIVADDIASFPDTNLAESLQRIPGVAITRDAGEGRQISLRGLGPEFTRVRLNGMDALSTSTSTDARGGTNRSRGFDFNIFASELFNRIDVTKSGDAQTGEGGLAGTVDLHTPRPFDFPGFKLAASAGGLYQENSEKTSPRAAVLLSNTFADGRLGALFSAAYSRRQTVEYGHSTVRWGSGGWNLDNVADSVDAGLAARLNGSGDDKLFYPRFDRYDVYDYDQKRMGLTGALQFQASDDTLFNLDLAYGRMRSEREEYHIDASSFSRANAPGLYNSGIGETTIKALEVAGNSIVYGDYGNVDIRSDNHRNLATTTYRQAVLSMDSDVSERLHVDALLGFQDSRLDNPKDNNLFFFSQNQDFSIDYRNNSRVPVMGYGFDIADPSQYFLDIVRIRHGETSNRFNTFKFDARYALTDVLTLKAGADAHSQTYSSAYWSSDFTDQRYRPVGDISTVLPHDFAGGTGVSGAPRGWLVADLDNAFATLGAAGYSPALDYGSTWSVNEKPWNLYAQLDFDSELGGKRWRGNLGLRYGRTRLASSGFVSDGSDYSWVTLDRSYGDLLPSFNSALELRQDLVWRLGANRNITRPTLASLAPNGSVNSLNRTVSAGNPGLDPFRADSIDTSLEWYFDEGGMLAVAAFYKKIDAFIVSTITEMSYTDSGYPLSLINQEVVTPDQTFSFVRPVNGEGTHLKGAEIAYQQVLDFLPGPLRNLGVQMNYTWADARIDVDTTGDGDIARTLLPGLSRSTVNGTLYWENDSFSARVSGTWRDRYVTAVPGGNGNSEAGVNDSLYLDLSLQYRFRPGWTLLLQGNNLTDEAEDLYVDSSNRVYNYTQAGRQFFLGVRFEL